VHPNRDSPGTSANQISDFSEMTGRQVFRQSTLQVRQTKGRHDAGLDRFWLDQGPWPTQSANRARGATGRSTEAFAEVNLGGISCNLCEHAICGGKARSRAEGSTRPEDRTRCEELCEKNEHRWNYVGNYSHALKHFEIFEWGH